MQEDFSVLIDPDDLYGIDTSGLLIREEDEPNKFISMSEKLIPNFIRTYKNETNKYDDYLNPKKRSKLAKKNQKIEEGLEKECLDFFQVELPNIKRVIEQAELREEWSSIIDICDNLTTFYYVSTYWKDLESILKTSLTAAEQVKNKLAEARIRNELARTFRLLGEAEKGIKYGLDSYKIFCSIKELEGEAALKGEAESSYNLGYLYRSVGNWEESIKSFENSLSLFKLCEDFVGEAETLDGLGQVYTKIENLKKAEKVLQESLKIKKEKVDDQFQISITLNNLGKVYKIKGNLEKAKELFEESLSIKKQIKDLQGQGVSYNELGIIYRCMKYYTKALEYFEKSLDIKKEVSSFGTGTVMDNQGQGLTYMEKGILYEERGEYEQALINWNNAKDKLNNYSPEFSRVTNYIKSLKAKME
jgi:tetratricopeptide (TPR) repeat protein